MEGHQRVVLEQRVRTLPVEGRIAQGAERVRRPKHEREEEERDGEADEAGPGDERVSDAGPELVGREGEEPAEDEDPQEDRAFQSSPESSDGEQQRGFSRVVRRHVLQREVVRDQRPFHRAHRDDGTAEDKEDGPTPDDQPSVVVGPQAPRQCADAEAGGAGAEGDAEDPERRLHWRGGDGCLTTGGV